MAAYSPSVMDSFHKATIKEILSRLLVVFPIGLFVVFSVFYFLSQLEYQKVTIEKTREDLGNLQLLQFIIRDDLEAIASDLLLLVNNEAFDTYFEESSEQNLSTLVERLKNFTRDKKIFNQVIFLDVKGREVVRLKMTGLQPEVVPEDKLQNKSQRSYFKETMKQKRGQLFVSPLDLNVENGEAEKLLLPVLRVGSPIVDRFGEKKGVVFLNFDARKIVDRFSQVFPDRDVATFSFINKEGYWLRGGRSADEWGFESGSNLTLELKNPELWSEIKQKQVGQVRLPGGLYTYTTIYAEDVIQKSIHSMDQINLFETHAHDDDKVVWHLILHVTKEDLSFLSFLRNHSYLFWLLPFVLLILVAVTLHIAIIRANKDVNDRSLRLLSTGLNQSPTAVVIADTDGNIEYVNPKFMQMSGYDLDSVIGKNPRIFKSGSTTEKTYQDLWQTLQQGDVWTGTFENKRKDHSSYFVSAKIAPIVSGTGKITKYIAVQEDITEKKKLQEKLEKMATIDGLTGAFNRSHFLKLFSNEVKRISRYEQELSVLAFDLDFFKHVNDTYGHHGGDLVLQHFTRAVKKELRGNDFLGRLGGEEFCVVLVQTGKEGALLLAERLRLVIENMTVLCDGKIIKVTVSIGVTEWSIGDVKTKDILKRADRALYGAKDAGRNQVRFLAKSR